MTSFEPISLENGQFLDDVLTGLSQTQKCLSAKYFYDDRGSKLFEDICDLDEYYLTRTELGILNQYGAEMIESYSQQLCMIEPGAGAGIKAAVLFEALGGGRQFIPLEISAEALSMAGQYLAARFPTLDIHPVHGDFTNPADVDRVARNIIEGERMVFFPGSTLGNFNRPQALEILANLRQLMGPQGQIIIGLDLIKDEQRLIAAYDDKKGVTAAFNKNILQRINSELCGNFDIDGGFEHQARFNSEHERIEMHLTATSDQKVEVAGQEFYFRSGESIHTENSHKYCVETVGVMCDKVGLSIDKVWRDDNKDFGVFRLINA